jgi:hypothetical protein
MKTMKTTILALALSTSALQVTAQNDSNCDDKMIYSISPTGLITATWNVNSYYDFYYAAIYPSTGATISDNSNASGSLSYQLAPNENCAAIALRYDHSIWSDKYYCTWNLCRNDMCAAGNFSLDPVQSFIFTPPYSQTDSSYFNANVGSVDTANYDYTWYSTSCSNQGTGNAIGHNVSHIDSIPRGQGCTKVCLQVNKVGPVQDGCLTCKEYPGSVDNGITRTPSQQFVASIIGFPNPTHDNFTIATTSNNYGNAGTVWLSNNLGQVVKTIRFTANTPFSVADVSTGMYQAKIAMGEYTTTLRIGIVH